MSYRTQSHLGHFGYLAYGRAPRLHSVRFTTLSRVRRSAIAVHIVRSLRLPESFPQRLSGIAIEHTVGAKRTLLGAAGVGVVIGKTIP